MISAEVAARLRQIKLVVFDFDGVFTNNEVIVAQDGTESVICNRSDGYAMRLLNELSLAQLILSTEANPVVSARARKLKMECIQGCETKGVALEKYCREKGVKLEQVAYVGNDVNDLPCFALVGVAVAVADAFPEALAAAHWVLEQEGGRGAIREFCEITYRVHHDIPAEESPWLFRERLLRQ